MEKSIRKKFWIFALPTMAAFTIGFIVPFVYGIFLSFCKFSTVTDWKWVGFKNYTRIFVVNGSVDTTFIHSIWYTALFTVVSVLIINIVSFAIAMALTKGIRGTNLFRTVFFLPNLIGGIVLSYVWLMIFNSILQNYSKTIVSSEWSAFWGLIAVVCWQQIGYMMIIYIAGIQNELSFLPYIYFPPLFSFIRLQLFYHCICKVFIRYCKGSAKLFAYCIP